MRELRMWGILIAGGILENNLGMYVDESSFGLGL